MRGRQRDGSILRQPRGVWLFLAAVCLVSIAVHTAFALLYEPIPARDGSARLLQAAADGAFKSYHPPLYILFLRGVLAVACGEGAAVAVVQGIFPALAVLPLFILGAALGGTPAGLVAAAIGGLYPPFALAALRTVPDAIGLLCVAILFALLAAMPSSRKKAAWAAVVTAAAAHVAPLLLFLAPGVFAAMRRRFVYLGVLVLCLLPWSIRNTVVVGSPVPLYRGAGYALAAENLLYEESRWEAVDAVYENAARVFSKGWRGDIVGIDPARRHARYAAAYAFILVLLLGMTALITRMRRVYLAPVLATAAYLVLSVVLTAFVTRYRYPLEVLLIPLAAQLLVAWYAAAARAIRARGLDSPAGILERVRAAPRLLVSYARSVPGRLKDPG